MRGLVRTSKRKDSRFEFGYGESGNSCAKQVDTVDALRWKACLVSIMGESGMDEEV